MNEGSLKLVAVKVSSAKVGALLGVSKAAVQKWRDGRSKPAPQARATLRELYGIDPGAWDRRCEQAVLELVDAQGEAPARAGRHPSLPKKQPRPRALGGDHPGAEADALEIIEYQLEDLVRLKDEIDEEGILADRLKVRDALSKCTATLAKARGELDKADETKLCKSSKWIRLRTTVIDALMDYPEALAAVVDALEKEEA